MLWGVCQAAESLARNREPMKVPMKCAATCPRLRKPDKAIAGNGLAKWREGA